MLRVDTKVRLLKDVKNSFHSSTKGDVFIITGRSAANFDIESLDGKKFYTNVNPNYLINDKNN